MDTLSNFCDNSLIDSDERRKLFIRQYLAQNYIDNVSENKFEASGLWIITDPVVANRWYSEIGDSESSK